MSELPETLAGVASADCTGLQALVTGSTSRIGRGAALGPGRLGADSIVHGRDPQAGADVVDELSQGGVDTTFHVNHRSPSLLTVRRTRRPVSAGRLLTPPA